LTDSFAKLVAIGLVYLILVILVRLLLVPLVNFFALRVPVVILFALPLAVTGHALDLSVLITTGQQRTQSRRSAPRWML
jgi:hypothetical protein